MMAFFLLMWLINTTTPEQKRGIADYFAPQSIAETVSGAGGILGGKVMGEDSAKAGGAASVFQKNAPTSPATPTKSTETGTAHGGSANANGQGAAGADDGHGTASTQQVIIENTPEGLRIQLVDQNGRPMFQQGSTEPMPYTKRLLAEIGRIVDRLPNRVSISGHTEAKAFEGPGGMTNWELSSARANAARALLTAGGLSQDRIYEVAGKAGSEPLLPEDPNASANRRLSIVLLREAPPVPPGHQL
jgi:chemotaxis protein MotB